MNDQKPLSLKSSWFTEDILKYMSYNNGIYIEAGAFDGVRLSNTFYLEEQKGWRGLLIEPSATRFEECKKNRSPKNYFEQCALVGDPDIKEIEGTFNGGPAATVKGLQPGMDRVHCVKVKASTLTQLLDKHNFPEVIDFLSLDTKGYELEVLKGIDFNKYKFKFILTEITYKHNKLSEFLEILEPAGMLLCKTVGPFSANTNPRNELNRPNLLFANPNV